MGSATREALAASRAELSALGKGDLATAEQLLSAGRVIGSSAQLQAVLSDPSTDGDAKRGLISGVFGSSLSAKTEQLLGTIVAHRWSNERDLLAGIEELGFRAAAESASATTNIEAELFAFGTAVSSDAQLELALGSKQGGTEAKLELVDALIAKKVSAQTLTIIRHLLQQPRGRRIGELLRVASSIVADQAGLSVATITSAVPIASAQLVRLQKGLAATYGRELKMNVVVDPSIIGGLRVQVGDDVIDGTVASKINELRLQLAG